MRSTATSYRRILVGTLLVGAAAYVIAFAGCSSGSGGGGATDDAGGGGAARTDGAATLPDGALPDRAVVPGSCVLVPGTTCPRLGWTLLLAAPSKFTNLIQHALAVADDGLHLAAAGTTFTVAGQPLGDKGLVVAHVGFDGTFLGHESFATKRVWSIDLGATGDAGYAAAGEFDGYLTRDGMGVDAGSNPNVNTQQAAAFAIGADTQTRWIDFAFGAPSSLVSAATISVVLPDGRSLIGGAGSNANLELRTAGGVVTYRTTLSGMNALAYDRSDGGVWMTRRVGAELHVGKLAVEDGGAGTTMLVATSFDRVYLSVRPEGGPVVAYQVGSNVEVRAFDSSGTLKWSGSTAWPAKMELRSVAGVTGGAAIVGSDTNGNGDVFERFGSGGGAATTRYSWRSGHEVSDLVRGPDDALYYSYGGFYSDVAALTRLDSGGGRSVWVSRLPD